MNIKLHTVHFAIDKNANIIATWYKGCVTPFNKWKKSCKNIGAIKFINNAIVITA